VGDQRPGSIAVNLALIAMALAVLIGGAGAASLDRALVR
jgi:hypothetical protein